MESISSFMRPIMIIRRKCNGVSFVLKLSIGLSTLHFIMKGGGYEK